MAEIRVNTDGLMSNKQAIEQRIIELEALNTKLAGLIERINDSWEGAASEQYIAKMRTYKMKAENMVEVLSEFKKYIEEAIAKFEHQDKSGASRIRGC